MHPNPPVHDNCTITGKGVYRKVPQVGVERDARVRRFLRDIHGVERAP